MIDWEFIKEALRKGTMHKLMDYLSVYGSAMVDEHEQVKAENKRLERELTQQLDPLSVARLSEINDRLRRENEDLESQVHYWHDAFENYKKAFYSEDRGEAVAVLRRELDGAQNRAQNRVADLALENVELKERIAKLEAREKEYIEECNKHFEAVQTANQYAAKLEAELKERRRNDN